MDRPAGPPAGADRRRGRRPRTHAAVLDATAELLASTPLPELSVAAILDAADVGRTSFYEHFASKEDVLVQLLRRVSAELGEELEPIVARGGRRPEDAYRGALTNLARVAARHAPLLLSASEEWPAIPELRGLWFRRNAALTDALAASIERDRAAGLAPPGADAQALAASLVWTAERVFHVAMSGADPALPAPAAAIEPLVQLFVGTIHGRALDGPPGAQPGPAAPRRTSRDP